MQTRQVAETIPGWGVDRAPERRPGVPRETAPLAPAVPPSPTAGSAQPPRGPSGVLRRLAYRIPDHHAPHWLLLLLADRVDSLEAAGREAARRHPVLALSALALGLLAGGVVVRAGRR